MGYSPGSQAQVMSLPPARPGYHPVNTDLVTTVARDCVLACVECGLLAEIHAAISVQFPTSMEEVIEFRRDHIGSAEVCVRELLYRKNQLRYQQYPVTVTSPQYGLQAFPHHPGPLSQSLPANGFPPAAFHPAPVAPVYGYPSDYSPGPVYPPGPAPHYVAVERLSGPHSQHSPHSPAGSSTSTLRQGQIPTTILELAAQDGHGQPQPPERRSRADREAGARPREHRDHRDHRDHKDHKDHKEHKEASRTGKSRKSGAEQDFDSWDYVYKHLQQTGYNKDQAERPDVLERNSSQSEEELRRNIQAMRLRDSARNGVGGGRPREQHNHRQSRVMVETSGSEVEQDTSRYSSAVSEETAGPHRLHRGEPGHQQHRRAELWECSTCTFHNKQDNNICEICSKSRDFQPPKEVRSVEPAKPARRGSAGGHLSGLPEDGVACEKCTLVNPNTNTVCEACGATLMPKSKLF